LLGLGEAANWPGATKAVAEWFPRKESGWAVALFDSGSSVGAALAPLLVLSAYHGFGSWRPVFLVTGSLGLLWWILFRIIYRRPEEHPRLSAAERDYILSDRAETAPGATGVPLSYRQLLSLPQTWGIMIGKALTDPVWFFITDWFAIYLVSKKFNLEDSLLVFWIPFVAADVGNFAGGGLSSYWIRRGWSVGAARKAVVVIGGLGMTLLIPTVFLNSLGPIVACFALSTLSYAAVSTMILNLPADVYPTQSVASVSGLSGTAAGIGTICATFLIGRVADASSFAPVLVGASLVPLLAVAAVLLLVRNNRATQAGVVRAV
jgi:ACS family hexuronate transporter-like MFS transporter